MNIRHTIIRLGAGLLIAALSTSAFASGTASATANATLTIMAPGTLTKVKDIAFGSIVRPSTGTNTVTLSSVNSSVTVTGTGDASTVAGATPSAAKFTFVAPPGTTYTTTQTLTFTQAGLANISASSPTTTTGTLLTVPAGGSQDLNLGGQFDISASTTAQAYTGSLALTVNYN